MNFALWLGLSLLGLLSAGCAWRRFRQAGIAALSLLTCLALAAALAPPKAAWGGRMLRVYGEGAPAEIDSGLVVRLPEAGAGEGLAVPDLAAALRLFPEAGRLEVHGWGLNGRDRLAATGMPLVLKPGELPVGLRELDYPARAQAGQALRVAGRVAGVAGAQLELRDPAGALAATVSPDGDGRFSLEAALKAAGRIAFELRVLDGQGVLVEKASLPVAVESGRALRLRLEAGGPDPEQKPLRRWAEDADLSLESRLGLSAGLVQGDADWQASAQELAALDLLIVDERSWQALDAGARRRIETAVGEGLGLLWRLRGTPTAELLTLWTGWGMAIAPGAAEAGFRKAWGLDLPLRVWGQAEGGQALLRDDGGARRLAFWPRGRGRVGISLVSGTQRLAAGETPAAFGRFWSGIVEALARPAPAASLSGPALWRAGQGGRLCGLAPGARWQARDGVSRTLDVREGCALLWPEIAGWHRLVDGERSSDWPILPAAALPGVRAQADRLATEAMTGAARLPGSRSLPGWPFLLLSLACLGGSWWLERRALQAQAPVDVVHQGRQEQAQD
ncbi:MAG: hypothetical protein HYV16_03870 [Gammaproteobacteria bacterium]|nr:hypothetical protein [Gammaproteobacteria bacterium]